MPLWEALEGFVLPINRDGIVEIAGANLPDREMMKKFLRLLDAYHEQASWKEAAEIILGLDVESDLQGSRAVFDKTLKQALWLRDKGYLDLTKSSPS